MSVIHPWSVRWSGCLTLALMLLVPDVARPGEELEALRTLVRDLEARDAERGRQLDALRAELDRLRGQLGSTTGPRGGESPLERALREAGAMPPPEAGPASAPRAAPPVELRLIDLSVDVLASVGSSTVRDDELRGLQAGEHDPSQRGFTLQQAELSLMGAVDPYLDGEAHLIYFLDTDGESRFEIEEAFATTRVLPAGLQLEFGQFFTEFGRMNPVHPHAWSWIDQPVVLSRFFGRDGLRQVGARLGWLLPLPFFSELHLGVQQADGETMVSFLATREVFEERAIGGRPFLDRELQRLDDLVYLLRWVNGFDVGSEASGQLGFSGLRGPNATGPGGWTRVYGTDLVLKWHPATSRRGWPFLVFESELLVRDYHADAFAGELQPGSGSTVFLPSETLHDWGLFAQLLWGPRRPWAGGLRFELSDGSGSSLGGTGADPFRDRRLRISPLLLLELSEFSRARLQYNYDRAEHLRGDQAHTVWLTLEFSLGAHPAHRY
ncbi:MAG: hypothetical protein ACE5FG_13220 [Myxococcota bacterium]